MGEFSLVWVNFHFKHVLEDLVCVCFSLVTLVGVVILLKPFQTQESLLHLQNMLLCLMKSSCCSLGLSHFPTVFLSLDPLFHEFSVVLRSVKSVMARAIASRQILLHMLVKAAVFFPQCYRDSSSLHFSVVIYSSLHESCK